MSEWDKLAVPCANTVMNMPYLSDRNERDYLLVSDDMRREMKEGWTLCPAMFWY